MLSGFHIALPPVREQGLCQGQRGPSPLMLRLVSERAASAREHFDHRQARVVDEPAQPAATNQL